MIFEVYFKFLECKSIVHKVIESSTLENVEPFQSKMLKFLIDAEKRLKIELEALSECKTVFANTTKFYAYSIKFKESKCNEVSPMDFFGLWYNFCLDFKNIWTREQQRLMKER